MGLLNERGRVLCIASMLFHVGAVTLLHGGTSYSGTVAADSSFATTPRDIDVGDGNQYRVTIAGKFGSRSFVADATVDRSRATGPCQYIAHWVGSR